MSDQDDEKLLIDVAKRVSSRLSELPTIARLLEDGNPVPFETVNEGWGIRIGKFKHLRISLHIDFSWQTPERSLWAGLEGSTTKPFDPLLKSAQFQGIHHFYGTDLLPLPHDGWRFKKGVVPPKDFAPVYEESVCFGIYAFGQDVDAFVDASTSFLTLAVAALLEDEILRNSPDLSETERNVVGLARVGQGKYRENVGLIEKGCRLTGVMEPFLLRASHIKPWSLCDNSNERLDGANGLLLTPTYDVMFDRGYLTFEADGRPRISSRLPKHVLSQINMLDPSELQIRPFSDMQKRYLDFHRKIIFRH
ncbi:HNH endonuclease [Methylocystis heyeri]|nr:HNH endonuclease [Methylocystis heyeri]